MTLWLVDQLAALPGKDYFSCFQFLVVLCRVENLWAFCIHISMLIVVFVHLVFRQLCWWNIWGVTSEITIRCNLIVKSLILWFLNFSDHFYNIPWALGATFVDVFIVTKLCNPVFWLFAVFHNVLCLFKLEIYLIGDHYIYL